jgi:N-acetylmuramoyl-L-alanine amidase
MPRKHVVQRHDCLVSIARHFGFVDYRDIYEDALNEDFRLQRPDPNVIFPGDVIMIPDPRPKTVDCVTNQLHSFIVKRPKRLLNLRLIDSSKRPLKDEPYELTIDKVVIPGHTDGDGRIKRLIPANKEWATLKIRRMTRRLAIADMNPMPETSDLGITGVQARLANLAYAPGPVDGVLGPRTRAAIEAFQADNDLEPSGKLSHPLFEALKRAHGS